MGTDERNRPDLLTRLIGDDGAATMTRVVGKVSAVGSTIARQLALVAGIPANGERDPVRMSDQELRAAVYSCVRHVAEDVGQRRIKGSYGDGVVGDPEFRHPLALRTQHQVLLMATTAGEAAGLAAAGLNSWASTAALSHMRYLHETQALLAWLLQDEEGRETRSFGLAFDSIDVFRRFEEYWMQAAKGDPEGKALARRFGELAGRMKDDLNALAARRGISPPSKPDRGALFNAHNADIGGYPGFAVLSNAGSHPSVMQPLFLYGDTATGRTDFDFSGKHAERAHWIGEVGEALLTVLELAAPCLGWRDWDTEAAALRAGLAPLRDEAARRFRNVKGLN
jgi:hypothetical protein